MRGASKSLWANGRLLLSRDAAIPRKVYINATFQTLTTPNRSLSPCGHRFQSTITEKSDRQTSKNTSSALTTSSVKDVPSITSEIPAPDNEESLSQDEKAAKPTFKPRKVYIAIGSNMGDRIDWLEKALRAMPSKGIKVLRASSLWETEPMYVTDQGKFLNGVVEVFHINSSLTTAAN